MVVTMVVAVDDFSLVVSMVLDFLVENYDSYIN